MCFVPSLLIINTDVLVLRARPPSFLIMSTDVFVLPSRPPRSVHGILNKMFFKLPLPRVAFHRGTATMADHGASPAPSGRGDASPRAASPVNSERSSVMPWSGLSNPTKKAKALTSSVLLRAHARSRRANFIR